MTRIALDAAENAPTVCVPFTGGLMESDDHLYFVRSADGFCKIGRSNDVRRRLSILRAASPHRLWMPYFLKGKGWQERVWHKAFAYNHHNGEWFRWDDKLAAAISAAVAGEEWIATLDPGDGWDVHQWRDRIADLEESAVDRNDRRIAGVRKTLPHPLLANRGGWA